MKRMVSVFLPHWPIERMQRAAQSTRQDTTRARPANPAATPGQRRHSLADHEPRPFALIGSCHRGLVIHALDQRAIACGLREGDNLADARARVPGLASAPAVPLADRAALHALALWCGRYGPAVNADGPRSLWIDITGVAHLFGGEAALLGDLERRLRGFGLTAHLGLAPTLGAAWALARFGDRRRGQSRQAAGMTRPVIGTERSEGRRLQTALAELPIEGLRLDAAAIRLLQRLGLKRIGQLTDVPRVSLERRFHSKIEANCVLKRLDQALGDCAEPLIPLRPAPADDARRVFSDPLISPQGLRAALGELTHELCAVLDARLLGARRLVLSVYRADGLCVEVPAAMSAPARIPAHMLRLLQDKLERLDMGLGIDALSLAATHGEPLRPTQATFAAAETGTTMPVAHLIDRLANKLGSHRVCHLALRESHIPERAQAFENALAIAEPARGAPLPNRMAWLRTCPPRPAILLAPPEPIRVIAEIPEGAPARFVWRRLSRRVLKADGPERIAPEWWRAVFERRPGAVADAGQRALPAHHQPPTRDYYRVEDEHGARYWIFRAGLYQERGESGAGPGSEPCWFVHGVFG